MKLLLDTQLFLWSLKEVTRVPPRATTLMQAAQTVYVSAASIWEITIKIGAGKLDGDPVRIADMIAASNFQELAVSARHGIGVRALPFHHKDPFDRLLVAQAIAEGLQLLTTDELLGLYSDQVIVV